MRGLVKLAFFYGPVQSVRLYLQMFKTELGVDSYRFYARGCYTVLPKTYEGYSTSPDRKGNVPSRTIPFAQTQLSWCKQAISLVKIIPS